MNLDLRDLMASKADSVEPPVLDPMAVVADGERPSSGDAGTPAAGASLALALTIGATTLLAGTRRRRPTGASR